MGIYIGKQKLQSFPTHSQPPYPGDRKEKKKTNDIDHITDFNTITVSIGNNLKKPLSILKLL